MRFEMKMPDLAATESEIRIARWMIEPGQKIQRGQPLLEVETDKAAMDVESVVSGVLTEVRSPANETVAVGQVIAVLEVEETTPIRTPHAPREVTPDHTAPTDHRPITSYPNRTPHAPREVTSDHAAPIDHKPVTADRPSAAVGMFARNRAAAAKRSGATAPTAPASQSPTPQTPAGIALSVAERTAGKRLLESKQTIPHYYLQTSVNASAMIARREAAGPVKPAWDAFFVLAVAKAIAHFERFRCRFEGQRLTPAGTDAIGVAVDVDGELYVVPIASPTAKTTPQISDEIRQGVQRLRSGDPEARQIRPALMTVTNLGVCNVERFIPIINPPEPAILGIGKVTATPVARDDGWIGVEPRCSITLCVDHRVASGKYAGEFLAAIVHELETI